VSSGSVQAGYASARLLDGDPVILVDQQASDALIFAALSESGANEIFSTGRVALETRLADEYAALLQPCEVDVLRWCFVRPAVLRDLPDAAAMRAEFASHWLADNTGGKAPHVIWSQIAEGAASYLLHVAPDTAWFAGHFPGQPVLPGVVQIDWAIALAKDLGIDAATFSGIPRVKFSSLVLPDAVLRLSLAKTANGLRFSYESHQGFHSQGAVGFG
jgi:hypothetical protein